MPSAQRACILQVNTHQFAHYATAGSNRRSPVIFYLIIPKQIITYPPWLASFKVKGRCFRPQHFNYHACSHAFGPLPSVS